MSARLAAILALLSLSATLYFSKPSDREVSQQNLAARRERGMVLYQVWHKARDRRESDWLDEQSLAVYGCHAKDLPRVLYQTERSGD